MRPPKLDGLFIYRNTPFFAAIGVVLEFVSPSEELLLRALLRLFNIRTLFLFLLSADLLPRLFHVQRVLFHDGAFTQDAPGAAEILQGFEERL